jgi:hypothetical protein
VARRAPEVGLSEDQILKVGQAFFEECAVNDREAKLFTAMMRLRQQEQAIELKHLTWQMRHGLARARVEIQERRLVCRERMTDLTIWKATQAEAEAESPNAAVPKGNLPEGLTAMPEVAGAKVNTGEIKGDETMAA